jgi:hypothetical protein
VVVVEIDIDRLYSDCVLGKPIHYDFSQGYGEGENGGWEIVYPDVAEFSAQECLRWADRYELPLENDPRMMERVKLVEDLKGTGDYSDEELAGLTVEQLAEAYVSNVDVGDLGDIDHWRGALNDKLYEENDRFIPIYNYLYPLTEMRHEPGDAQAILDENPVATTVVLVNDTPFLALTGCGMDMTWDVVKSYVLLGLLPPLHFCDLPVFAGHKLSELDRATVKACLKTCEVVKGMAEQRAEDLKKFLPKKAKKKGVKR